MKVGISVALALSLVAAGPALGQDKPDDKPAKVEMVVPQTHTTKLSGVFGGQKVSYSATIAETILSAEDGTQKAAIVTTSYVREPRDPSRPVTFLFNGGPGSGSVWLQMGAFGPNAPICSQTVPEPGPPLNRKVTGRDGSRGSLT